MNALDYAGYSCLSLAAAKGRVLIARLLIKKGADVNLPGRNARRPIHEVCLRANRRFAPRDSSRLLLTHHAEPDVPDDDGRTPLMHCVGRKHRDEFQDSFDSDDENDAEARPRQRACRCY